MKNIAQTYCCKGDSIIINNVVDPISNDSAEVFGLKVGIDMANRSSLESGVCTKCQSYV